MGEIAPEKLPLIVAGSLKNTLVSTRTEKEYNVKSNFASSGESLRSPIMSTGNLKEQEILSKIDKGVYLSIDKDRSVCESLKDLSLNKIEKPACFITGSLDPVNFFIPNVNFFESIGENYNDLRTKEIIENVGHWTQQEAPEEVNEFLLNFLKQI